MNFKPRESKLICSVVNCVSERFLMCCLHNSIVSQKQIMNQDFSVKKAILSKNKFVQGVSPGKKIPAQAVREKKKSYQLKIPHPPSLF